jgi:hypothetical protein
MLTSKIRDAHEINRYQSASAQVDATERKIELMKQLIADLKKDQSDWRDTVDELVELLNS